MPGTRSDGRPHDTGRVSPRRPCPRDFRETYIRIGWDGIEDHYRTNSRIIARWIDECGREELRRARAGYVLRNGHRRLHLVGRCGADRVRVA